MLNKVLIIAIIAIVAVQARVGRDKNQEVPRACPTDFVGPFTYGARSFCTLNVTTCDGLGLLDAASACLSINARLCSVGEYINLFSRFQATQHHRPSEGAGLKSGHGGSQTEYDVYWANGDNTWAVDYFQNAAIAGDLDASNSYTFAVQYTESHMQAKNGHGGGDQCEGAKPGIEFHSGLSLFSNDVIAAVHNFYCCSTF